MYIVRFWRSPSGREPVQKWLDKLSYSNAKKITKLINMIREEGFQLGMPHNKYLGNHLYELRDIGHGPGYRVYYSEVEGEIIILLAACDKDSQKRDIEVARKRMNNIEVEDEDN